jgi:hypothetical protein
MTEKKRTRVAVLGTLAEFHRESIPYNLSALLDLVAAINPDLLCLDITPEQWQAQSFSDLPPEYQEALLPLARQTDIVIAPIGEWLRRRIATIQRTAPSPDAMNQGWRHDLANHLYSATQWLVRNGIETILRERTDRLTQNIYLP